jgi:hypothetical protein
MRLRPNPPRVVTIVVAIVLAVVGAIYAWPVESLVTVLAPIAEMARSVGVTLDRQLGFVFLFASPALLVIGSLLPGI